jgi:hypothetical protein
MKTAFALLFLVAIAAPTGCVRGVQPLAAQPSDSGSGMGQTMTTAAAMAAPRCASKDRCAMSPRAGSDEEFSMP